MNELYELAQRIRMKTRDFDVPWELHRLLQNIDLGAIKPEYRTWVLEDAEAKLESWAN